jgi:hypothetical protein
MQTLYYSGLSTCILLPQNTLFSLDIQLNVHLDFSPLMSFLVKKQRMLLLALKLLNARPYSYLVVQLALSRSVIQFINKSLKARIEDLAEQYIDENERD